MCLCQRNKATDIFKKGRLIGCWIWEIKKKQYGNLCWRIEQYNVNLFTSHSPLGFRLYNLSLVCGVKQRAQIQCTCHNQQGNIGNGKKIFLSSSVWKRIKKISSFDQHELRPEDNVEDCFTNHNNLCCREHFHSWIGGNTWISQVVNDSLWKLVGKWAKKSKQSAKKVKEIWLNWLAKSNA